MWYKYIYANISLYMIVSIMTHTVLINAFNWIRNVRVD